MGKVIHRIDAPCIAGAMVMGFCNTVDNRVTHIDIRRCHVDFCTQHFGPVGKFAVFHSFKQRQVFFHRTVAVRTVFARFC